MLLFTDLIDPAKGNLFSLHINEQIAFEAISRAPKVWVCELMGKFLIKVDNGKV